MKQTTGRPTKAASKSSVLSKGTVRPTNAFKQLTEDLEQETSYVDALPTVGDMLLTPQRKIYKHTKFDSESGAPLEGKFIIDRTSVPKSLRFVPCYESIGDVKLHKALQKQMQAVLDDLKSSNSVSVVVDSTGNPVMVIRFERVATGGGHNDATTYDDSIIFTLVSNVVKLES